MRLKKICAAAVAAASLIFISSCSSQQAYEYNFFAADTYITLKIYGVADPETVCADVEKQTAELEKILSCNADDSELAKINASPAGEYTVSNDLSAVISVSLAEAKSSGGVYDPTIAPLVTLWNIGHGGEHVPKQSDIEAALALVGYSNVKLEGNTLTKLTDYTALDLGGSGKGYMLGKAVQLLEKSGGSGVVSFGGNIGVYGVKPSGDTGANAAKWTVAVKNPRDTDAVIGTISISSGFVSVSGDYERYFIEDGKRYCHIIDPSTGWPVQNGVQSVAVWTENATEGDLASTALFVMGKDKGIEYCETNGIAAVYVTDDGIYCTSEMEKLFTPAQ
jgi:Membrane-associated lipoprotein involved in thiamine biosynthesis